MERKRKQDEKRQHKAKRKQDASNPAPRPVVDSQENEQPVSVATQTPSSLLSPAQRTVLTTFRQFRMTPGQMLCFSRSDEDTLRAPLTELAAGGYLVTERFQGGYSLTASGFAAMQSIS